MRKPLAPTLPTPTGTSVVRPTLCGIMTVATWERLLSNDLDPFLRTCYADWLEENPDPNIIVIKREDQARGWRELVKRGYVPAFTQGSSGTNDAWCWFREQDNKWVSKTRRWDACGWFLHADVKERLRAMVPEPVFCRLHMNERSGKSAIGHDTSLEAEKDMVRVLAGLTKP